MVCRALDGSWIFSVLVAILTGSARIPIRLGAGLGEDAEQGAVESSWVTALQLRKGRMMPSWYGLIWVVLWTSGGGSEGCSPCGHGSFRCPADLRCLGCFFSGSWGCLEVDPSTRAMVDGTRGCSLWLCLCG